MKRKIGDIAREIADTYEKYDINHFRTMPLPSRGDVIGVLTLFFEIIYPGYYGKQHMLRENALYRVGDLLDSSFDLLREQIYRAVLHECRQADQECGHCHDYADQASLSMLERIPHLRAMLSKDVAATFEGDPAAKNNHEIIFSYPGIEAITIFRIAHEILKLGVPLIPRIMTEYAHGRTGIDIHPGAEIGEHFFIDHGTGIVIGETTRIGNHVRIYQGVTLGALSIPKGTSAADRSHRPAQRHPTIEDDVVIYSGATILGGGTVIGRGSVIGGNVWITDSVPPNTKVIVETHAQRAVPRKNGIKPRTA